MSAGGAGEEGAQPHGYGGGQFQGNMGMGMGMQGTPMNIGGGKG